MLRITRLCVLVCALLLISAQANALPIFINEFHYDNVGADTNEFIEIAGPAGFSVQDWQLILYNGSNAKPYKQILLTGLFQNLMNGFGVLAFVAEGLQNGAPDAIALVSNTDALIEFISYEGEITALSGPAQGVLSENVGLSESSQTPLDNSLYRSGIGDRSSDFYWVSGLATFSNINSQQTFFSSSSGKVPVPATLGLMLLPLLIFARRGFRSVVA